VEPGGGPVCPRCGAPYSRDQEYCLDCGLRLAGASGLISRLARAWRLRLPWYPGDWIWPALLGLVIAIAGGAAAVAVADSGRESSTLNVTHPGSVREPVPPPSTATVALPSVPRGTPTTKGPPETPTNPPPPSSAAPPPGSLVPWPASRNGYTVVLESIPTSAGRGLAVQRARSASKAGLPQVGVLTSSLYSSLHPGYYVVFSGIYASKSRADAAAGTAAGKGFTAAYSRQITR
jgi:hypothetical protein